MKYISWDVGVKNKEILKKRSKIENSHAWKETIIPRLGKIYDKNYINFAGINFLSIINLIINRKVINVNNL